MTYLFDNDISPKHADVLRLYGVVTRTVRSEFGQDAKDRDFIPQLQGSGWVIVSGDRHITTRPPEARALRASGVTALFLGPFWRKLSLKEQAAWLLRNWDKIDKTTTSYRQGTIARVKQNGNIEVIESPQPSP
ncbi:MAG: hypothetical protein RDU83_00425 [bacterium]|nr:hypothetical protein [bacterium]